MSHVGNFGPIQVALDLGYPTTSCNRLHITTELNHSLGRRVAYFVGYECCSNDGKAYIEPQEHQKGQHYSAIIQIGIQYCKEGKF